MIEDMINNVNKRIDFIKMELIHRDRLDGWTIKGLEEELVELTNLSLKINEVGSDYNKIFKL